MTIQELIDGKPVELSDGHRYRFRDQMEKKTEDGWETVEMQASDLLHLIPSQAARDAHWRTVLEEEVGEELTLERACRYIRAGEELSLELSVDPDGVSVT